LNNLNLSSIPKAVVGDTAGSGKRALDFNTANDRNFMLGTLAAQHDPVNHHLLLSNYSGIQSISYSEARTTMTERNEYAAKVVVLTMRLISSVLNQF
jgi:hypothetical protein